MSNINAAFQWAVNTCNAANVGYSQAYRNEQTINGITYYDCSSFIWYALIAGGFDCVSANGGSTWAFTTDTMPGILPQLGFTAIPITEEWKPGDILWRDGHTEMVYSGYRTMGAHTDSYDLADQVSINTYESSTNDWAMLYRFGGGATGTVYSWIYGEENEYFGEGTIQNDDSRKLNNGCCVYAFFSPKGWTIQAIAALLANMNQESTLNPCLIELGGTGHGLVQWTPPENLYDVLDVLYGSHDDWHDGDKQCNVIYAEYQESVGEQDRGIEPQWYETDSYPISWKEWAQSTSDPGELAMAFQYNYERPEDMHLERKELARAWYEYLLTVDISGGTTTKTKKRKGFKFVLFNSQRRFSNRKRY